MKHIFLGLLLYLCFDSFAQHHDVWAGYSNVVFVENANVRNAPSLEGKIIGTLKHNTTIEQDYTVVGASDTIAGVIDFWLPIKYQNTVAFIWNPVLAQNAFTSDLISKKTFLFKFSGTRNAEFKIFENEELVQQYSFRKKFYTNAVSWNMGKTYNSNGNELIVVKYYNDTLSGYELFEWTGDTLKPSKVKLNDDSFITQKYIEFKKGIVNSNGVNLREAPDKKAATMVVLQKNTLLDIVSTFVSEQPFEFWHKVRWKGKEVFIWYEYLDIPFKYIKSNVNINESFLLTNNAVYALNNKKIVSRVAKGGHAEDDFHFDGNKGFAENFQFFSICMHTEACGETGGDEYILWKDGKLSSVACDCGSGDGGYSSNTTLVFPNQSGGAKDKILITVESNVYDESEETTVTTYKSVKIMEFRNDSLVEVPSKHSVVRNYITKNYPNYDLMSYDFIKLNNDTVNDLMFFLHPINIEEGLSKLKPLIGYALADSLGNYLVPVTCSQMVQEEYFSVEYSTTESVLKIRVKYGLFPDGESDNAYYTDYNYKFDPSLNAFVWYSVSSGRKVDTEDDKFQWGDIKTNYFKSKKIKFENTWNYFPNGLPQNNSEEEREGGE